MPVKQLEIAWRWLRVRAARLRRVQLALALRVTLSAIAALIVAQALNIPLPLWTVLTAVIVTQMSVGRSLKASADYLIGTIGGAIYGGAVAIIIPHGSEWALLVVLFIAVAPLALFAATRANMNVLPITAIIVLLVPTITHTTPFYSAVFRVVEVAVGAVIGLLVSFIVLPSRAHPQMRQAGARTLELMARVLTVLLGSRHEGIDDNELHRLQDGIGQALNDLNTIGVEAERERRARLSREAETGPLRRTLLRLRHDLVIVGRAVGEAMPEEIRRRLQPRLDAVAATASDYMTASASALLVHEGPASLEPFEQALTAYGLEIAAMRQEGVTRGLPGETAERFFAMGFALEQVHRNFRDLERVVAEWGPRAEQEEEEP
jgi:uncharacterized membrane protein YccC